MHQHNGSISYVDGMNTVVRKQRPHGYQTLHDANAAYYESEDTGQDKTVKESTAKGPFSHDPAAQLKVTEGRGGQGAVVFPSIGAPNSLKRMPLPQIPKRKSKQKAASTTKLSLRRDHAGSVG